MLDPNSSDPSSDPTLLEEIHTSINNNDPIAGILTASGETISIFSAAKCGLIRNGTAVALLEAQAATGCIINPNTGEKLTPKEAKQSGFLDHLFTAVVERAISAVTGYNIRMNDPITGLPKEKISNYNVNEAIQTNVIKEKYGMRLLEAQLATGGLIDPATNLRLPNLDSSIDRNLISQKWADILSGKSHLEFKMFFDPNNDKVVSYKELMSSCVVDDYGGMRLLPVTSEPSQRRLSSDRISKYSSKSGSLTSLPDSFPFNFGLEAANKI